MGWWLGVRRPGEFIDQIVNRVFLIRALALQRLVNPGRNLEGDTGRRC